MTAAAAGHWLGLMSGTSCDGVDAALLWVDGRQDAAHPTVQLKAFATLPYAPDQRQQLLRVGAGHASVAELCELNAWLGHRLADAAEHVLAQAGLPARALLAVGSHGHTVCHLPNAAIPCTLQLGEPAVLAARLGCRVVADFRPADMAVGP
jgi:anhydro-N-acetylmuramic acid kinase